MLAVIENNVNTLYNIMGKQRKKQRIVVVCRHIAQLTEKTG